MQEARTWIERHLRFWQDSFDQLDGLLEELKKAEGQK